MEREIINRGYLTHALTDGQRVIYGIIKEHYINFETYKGTLYWSEVFVDGSHTIIRRGQLLVNKTAQELEELFNQSKINLNYE